MVSLKDQMSRLVYSTDQGRLCPSCHQAEASCICADLAEKDRLKGLDGIVRLRRETSGRKGKAVTTLSGVPLPEPELKSLLKRLKQGCGSGGAVKGGIIEIQGDHRDKLKDMLEKEGYTVKFSGG